MLSLMTKRMMCQIALLIGVFSSSVYAMDFQSAYDLMLKNNGDYQAELHQYKASRYDAGEALSNYFPSVSLSADYGHSQGYNKAFDQPIINGMGNSINETDGSEVSEPSLAGGVRFDGLAVSSQGEYDSGSATFNLTQPIINKALWNNVSRAKSQSKESYYELLIKRETLILELLKAYTNLLNAKDEQRILSEELAALDKHRNLTKRRHEEGLGTLTDVYEAESRYKLAAASLLSARFEIGVFTRELEVLVGEKISDVDQVLGSYVASLDIGLEGFDPENIKNNNILLAEQSVKTALYERRRRRSAFLPTLNFRAQSSYNRSEFSNISNESDNQSNRLFLELEVPLFSSFGNFAAVKSATHTLKSEKALLRDTLNQERNAMVNSRLNYRTSYERLVAFEDAYKASKQALDLREKSFLEGLSSNLDLLDAVRDTYRSERSWRDAVYALINSKMELIASIREISDADIDDVNAIFTVSEDVLESKK